MSRCVAASIGALRRTDARAPSRIHGAAADRKPGRFAAFPVYLAMRGAPTALEVAAFAWLIAPILLSWFLSRTGRYEGAHVLSSLALAGLVMTVAMMTGGIESFAAIWLVVVPLEAALSASRRVVAFASALALSCAALLIVFGHFGMLPAADAEPAFARHIHGVRRGLGDALCRRACVCRGVAGAHQRRTAQRRGRSISPAGPQHERRDLASSPQRRGAIHFAGRGDDVGNAGRATARPRPVRPRPRRRSSGLSHRAFGRGARRRGTQRRISSPARSAARGR